MPVLYTFAKHTLSCWHLSFRWSYVTKRWGVSIALERVQKVVTTRSIFHERCQIFVVNLPICRIGKSRFNICSVESTKDSWVKGEERDGSKILTFAIKLCYECSLLIGYCWGKSKTPFFFAFAFVLRPSAIRWKMIACNLRRDSSSFVSESPKNRPDRNRNVRPSTESRKLGASRRFASWIMQDVARNVERDRNERKGRGKKRSNEGQRVSNAVARSKNALKRVWSLRSSREWRNRKRSAEAQNLRARAKVPTSSGDGSVCPFYDELSEGTFWEDVRLNTSSSIALHKNNCILLVIRFML